MKVHGGAAIEINIFNKAACTCGRTGGRIIAKEFDMLALLIMHPRRVITYELIKESKIR